MPTVCKTRHRASRRRRLFLRHARRLGAAPGPSVRGQRSCLIVGLLPPDIARRRAIVLASGDPSHWRPDPLYCRAALRRRVRAVGSQGHVLATYRARTLLQRVFPRPTRTAIADPRRGSGYRDHGFGRGRDAAPLSGTAYARGDHGRHEGPHRRSSQTSVRLHREIAQSALRLAPGVGHMLHYAVPDQVVDPTQASFSNPTTLRSAAGKVEPKSASLETVAPRP